MNGSTRSPVELTRVNRTPWGATLWRVGGGQRPVLGHIEQSSSPAGDVYIAKRLNAVTSSFTSLGSFSRFDEAIESVTNG